MDLGGVALIVEILTDNRNRTASSVKSSFDKNGGNLGTPGCVSYMFERKGEIIIEKTADSNEDELMMIALDSGMDDMKVYDDSFYITTPTDTFDNVLNSIKEAKYSIVEADISYVPSIEVETLSPEDLRKIK